MLRLRNYFAISAALLIGCWSVVPLSADLPRTGSVQEIIGGSDLTIDTPSWMVALINTSNPAAIPNSRRQFCGGVLISSEWILTAAHCVLRITTANAAAIIGQPDIDDSFARQRSLSQIVVHPHYNSRTFENDVALLKLEQPTVLAPIEILDAASALGLSGQTAKVFGWGQAYISPESCEPVFASDAIDADDYECRVHDFERSTRHFQDRLLEANITLLTDSECNARIVDLLESLRIDLNGTSGDIDFTPENQLCAHDPVETQGVCFGDSGGPITIERNGKLVLVGTASLIFGRGGCARELATDVFTLTAPYNDFIDDVMRRDFALSFENYCPPALEPQVDFKTTAGAETLTRIHWQAAEDVSRYILNYALQTAADDEMSTLILDGSLSEISGELEPGTNFYVSVQAENEACTSPISSVLTVRVPAL